MRRTARVSLCAAALVACSLGVADAAVNQSAIDCVTDGRAKVARASWWGFDPADATGPLQAAINSGARKLIVENMGSPWIVEPITLASDQEVVFEPGVEVLAKAGAFRGTSDSLFRANLGRNITLIGYGAVWRMRRDDYAHAPYARGEWRMALELDSCTNVRVYGLTLTESGGDGIYLGTAKEGVPNSNIHIKDVICRRNYRQGISVINARDLLIENTVMEDTAGTAPMAGIDFEPNSSTEMITATMRNCVTRGNRGGGYALYLPALNATSAPVSLRFENCRSFGDRGGGLMIATGNSPAAAVRGSMEFHHCTFWGRSATGLLVMDKPAAACPILFDACRWICTARTAALTPLSFIANQGSQRDVGGAEFRDCEIRDRAGRVPMGFGDYSAGAQLSGISGSLRVARVGGYDEVPLTARTLAKWMPTTPLKPIAAFPMKGVRFAPVAPAPAGANLAPRIAKQRATATFLVHAEQGQSVRLLLSHGQVGGYAGAPIPVTVVSPSGREVARVEAAFVAETPVSFTAPETGLYRVSCVPGANYAQLLESSAPACLTGEDAPVALFLSVGTLYFWVPAGTREFGVLALGGDSGEGLKAGVYDASGKLVQEADNILRRQQFVVTRPAGAPGEVWSVCVDRPSQLPIEDFSIQLQGIPPLLFGSSEAVLVPEEGVGGS